ncbi:MAG: DUF1801 domain-containing protein [Gammaproteobacteria bacterium]|nr:MAG: DUF1801 domain-containing protein [Gammaproteobacteria bacterium]
MKKFNDKAVGNLFKSYPFHARKKLMDLRALIFEVAAQDKNIGVVEECLKWGEPAYVTIDGSTIRINWKPSSPTQFFVYFNCKTTLVETFKELYGDTFSYQGNRAIVLSDQEEILLVPLKHCIALSLNYHRIKHLPLLGA